ncbi:MAG TPA: amino acid aminotransferase [Chthonomonadales bacterium]|nr:amino acid aminotransferase [Chthonomonadales bacterium]
MPAPSAFAGIETAPPDPILGLTEAFIADPNPHKVNLGVGVYQNACGRVPLLTAVQEAQKRWIAREDTKSYLPIDGLREYNRAVQQLLFGAGSAILAEQRAVTVQGLGGTGSLRVGADFLRRFFPRAAVWISAPSWENHRALFEGAGFRVETYPYYDPGSHGLDFDAMLSGLRAAPSGDVVVLHACCHNPSGVDPMPDQWAQVVAVCAERGLIPFLDCAYQGLGDGLEQDVAAVHAFVDSRLPFLVATSFSKSFSLYRERVGALTVVAPNAEEARRLLTQLKRVIRTNYSNPPSHGAQTVALVLGDPQLRAQWVEELEAMRQRIQAMRDGFVAGLASEGVDRDFSFIARQKGMFSFSGLTKEQVRRLRAESSLYILDSGRICVAAMNDGNLPTICRAIAGVLRT